MIESIKNHKPDRLQYVRAGCGRKTAHTFAHPALVPDEWHIEHVGRRDDGTYFHIASQLSSDGKSTRDFVCTFNFDDDGNLLSHNIELVGTRRQYERDLFPEIYKKHLDALGSYEITDIWIKPYEVSAHGEVFGMIVRSPEEFLMEGDDPTDLDENDWRIEFMPGNTLSFYPPWEDGGYDT